MTVCAMKWTADGHEGNRDMHKARLGPTVERTKLLFMAAECLKHPFNVRD